MDRQAIESAFESFFAKYKKTEGDGTQWSAFWLEPMPSSGALVTIIMMRCPTGTRFRVFRDYQCLGELNEWEGFHAGVAELVGPDWDPDAFFGSMERHT